MSANNSDNNNLKRLTEELSLSKKSFRNYSHQLKQESVKERDEILRQLSIMRSEINETINKLSHVVKHILDKIGIAWQKILLGIENVEEIGYAFWLIGVISCSSLIVVSLFLILPLSFTCCQIDNIAGTAYQMTAWIVSLFSIALGFFTIFELIIGGHGEVFVCRVFYEKPELVMIGKLFDNPGMIYRNPPKNGILSEILVSDRIGTSFTNKSLTKVLAECENDQSAYYTFQIDNLLDLKNVLNYENYPDLANKINGINASEAPFKSLTQKLQFLFTDLIRDSDVNFTKFRNEITQISPDKEITNFIDQLQRVSFQIDDTSTASRMESLVAFARRLVKYDFGEICKISNCRRS